MKNELPGRADLPHGATMADIDRPEHCEECDGALTPFEVERNLSVCEMCQMDKLNRDKEV